MTYSNRYGPDGRVGTMYDSGIGRQRERIADFLDATRRGRVSRGDKMEQEQEEAETREAWKTGDPAMTGMMLGSAFGSPWAGAAIGAGLGLARGITSGKNPKVSDVIGGMVPSPIMGVMGAGTLAKQRAANAARGMGGPEGDDWLDNAQRVAGFASPFLASGESSPDSPVIEGLGGHSVALGDGPPSTDIGWEGTDPSWDSDFLGDGESGWLGNDPQGSPSPTSYLDDWEVLPPIDPPRAAKTGSRSAKAGPPAWVAPESAPEPMQGFTAEVPEPQDPGMQSSVEGYSVPQWTDEFTAHMDPQDAATAKYLFAKGEHTDLSPDELGELGSLYPSEDLPVGYNVPQWAGELTEGMNPQDAANASYLAAKMEDSDLSSGEEGEMSTLIAGNQGGGSEYPGLSLSEELVFASLRDKFEEGSLVPEEYTLLEDLIKKSRDVGPQDFSLPDIQTGSAR